MKQSFSFSNTATTPDSLILLLFYLFHAIDYSKILTITSSKPIKRSSPSLARARARKFSYAFCSCKASCTRSVQMATTVSAISPTFFALRSCITIAWTAWIAWSKLRLRSMHLHPGFTLTLTRLMGLGTGQAVRVQLFFPSRRRHSV